MFLRPLINLLLCLRNSVRKLGTKTLDQVRHFYTEKLTFISPDQLKTAIKVSFICLFAAVLIYVLGK